MDSMYSINTTGWVYMLESALTCNWSYQPQSWL